MRIVRTIGQAFEVCHKLTSSHAVTVIPEQVPAEKDGSQSGDTDKQIAKCKSLILIPKKSALVYIVTVNLAVGDFR